VKGQPAFIQPLFELRKQALPAEDNIRLVPPAFKLHPLGSNIIRAQNPRIVFAGVPAELPTLGIGQPVYYKAEIIIADRGRQTTCQRQLVVTDYAGYLEYAHELFR
jgi:hypothetical protein